MIGSASATCPWSDSWSEPTSPLSPGSGQGPRSVRGWAANLRSYSPSSSLPGSPSASLPRRAQSPSTPSFCSASSHARTPSSPSRGPVPSLARTTSSPSHVRSPSQPSSASRKVNRVVVTDGGSLPAAMERRDVPGICDALIPAFRAGVQIDILEAAVYTLKVRWAATIATRERQLIKINELEKRLEAMQNQALRTDHETAELYAMNHKLRAEFMPNCADSLGSQPLYTSGNKDDRESGARAACAARAQGDDEQVVVETQNGTHLRLQVEASLKSSPPQQRQETDTDAKPIDDKVKRKPFAIDAMEAQETQEVCLERATRIEDTIQWRKTVEAVHEETPVEAVCEDTIQWRNPEELKQRLDEHDRKIKALVAESLALQHASDTTSHTKD